MSNITNYGQQPTPRVLFNSPDSIGVLHPNFFDGSGCHTIVLIQSKHHEDLGDDRGGLSQYVYDFHRNSPRQDIKSMQNIDRRYLDADTLRWWMEYLNTEFKCNLELVDLGVNARVNCSILGNWDFDTSRCEGPGRSAREVSFADCTMGITLPNERHNHHYYTLFHYELARFGFKYCKTLMDAKEFYEENLEKYPGLTPMCAVAYVVKRDDIDVNDYYDSFYKGLYFKLEDIIKLLEKGGNIAGKVDNNGKEFTLDTFFSVRTSSLAKIRFTCDVTKYDYLARGKEYYGLISKKRPHLIIVKNDDQKMQRVLLKNFTINPEDVELAGL